MTVGSLVKMMLLTNGFIGSMLKVFLISEYSSFLSSHFLSLVAEACARELKILLKFRRVKRHLHSLTSELIIITAHHERVKQMESISFF